MSAPETEPYELEGCVECGAPNRGEWTHVLDSCDFRSITCCSVYCLPCWNLSHGADGLPLGLCDLERAEHRLKQALFTAAAARP